MPRMNLYAPISGVFKDNGSTDASGVSTPGSTSQGGRSTVPKSDGSQPNNAGTPKPNEKAEAKPVTVVGKGGPYNAFSRVAVANAKPLIDETEVDKYNEKAEALFGTGIHPEPEKVYTTTKDVTELKKVNAGVVSITGEELEAIKKDKEVEKLKAIAEVKSDTTKNFAITPVDVVDPDAVLVKKEKSEVVVPHAPKVVSYDEHGEQVLEDAKVELEAREVRTPGELTASEALERALSITNKQDEKEKLADIRSSKALRVFIGTNPGFRSHPLILKFGTARVATLPLDVIYKLLEAGAHLYTVPDGTIDNTKLANDRLVLTFLKDSPADSKDVIKEGLGNIMTYSAYVKAVKKYEEKKVEEAKAADEKNIEELLEEVAEGIADLNREELIHRIKNIGYIESLVADYEVKHAETEAKVKEYLGKTKAAFEQLKTAMKTAKR